MNTYMILIYLVIICTAGALIGFLSARHENKRKEKELDSFNNK